MLGRDIVGEVVYKGYLFPLGHRASLVKLTERLFLRAHRRPKKARPGRRESSAGAAHFLARRAQGEAYPAVGQRSHGRLWCAQDVTM